MRRMLADVYNCYLQTHFGCCPPEDIERLNGDDWPPPIRWQFCLESRHHHVLWATGKCRILNIEFYTFIVVPLLGMTPRPSVIQRNYKHRLKGTRQNTIRR